MRKKKKLDSIFDIAIAIEVCRQQPDTLELAEELAMRHEKWELLVQIYMENRVEYEEKALMIIDEKIERSKLKLDLLKQYSDKFFKANTQKNQFIGANLSNKTQSLLKKLSKKLFDQLR